MDCTIEGLRWVVGLFTGHCHLKGHLFKLGLIDDPTCETCLEDNESDTHILCVCEAIAYLRFCRLGRYFLEPSDYYDDPINKVLHFIRSAGLIKGQSKGKAQQIIDGCRARARLPWSTLTHSTAYDGNINYLLSQNSTDVSLLKINILH
jgi:hypothetical protein